MQKSFQIINSEISLAAVQDAKNFGLEAVLKTENGLDFIHYSNSNSYPELKVNSATPADADKIYAQFSSELQYQMKWLREDYNYLAKQMSEHMKGHLPAIKDAGLMEKALKVLGLSDSYAINKPTIYIEY
jgi:hypothetical protein